MNRTEIEQAAPIVERVEGLFSFFKAGVLNLDEQAMLALSRATDFIVPNDDFFNASQVMLSEKSIRMERVDDVTVMADETASGSTIEITRKLLNEHDLLNHDGSILEGLLPDGRINYGPYHNAANLADELIDKFEEFNASIIKLTERDLEELTHKHCVDLENDHDSIFEGELNSRSIRFFRNISDRNYKYSFVKLYPAMHQAEVPYAALN